MGGNVDLSDFPTPGTILVLNQTKFDDDYAEQRVGTEEDVKSLKRVFSDELKFTWEQADDLTVAEIHQKIKEYAEKDYSDVGALAIVVLTHGRESGVLCAKDATYKFIHIFEPIRKSETLHNKLKWFIVQACRSGDSDKYEQRVKLPIDNRIAKVPIYLSRVYERETMHQALSGTINTVISFSTVEGRVSTRSKDNGSIMIQTLCNQLETSTHEREPLLTMLCHVNRTVSSFSTFEDGNKTFAQTPSFMSSLRHDIFFPKLPREQLAAGGSVPTSSPSQLDNPIEREECKISSEQPNETLDMKSDGKLVKKARFAKVEPYPMHEKYNYAGRAYILHDRNYRKDLIEQVETMTRDTLKLTPVKKQVAGTYAAIQELKQVALNNNFQQEAYFIAFVLLDFYWVTYNPEVSDLKRAFFATSCTTLASKPKIFIFVDSGRERFYAVGGSSGPEADSFEELRYANQHSDMLFVNSFSTDFLSTLLKTLGSPCDLITLITDAFGASLERLQSPEYISEYIYNLNLNTSTNDLPEHLDFSDGNLQEMREKLTGRSTILDSTLRFPIFCQGKFEHCIPFAKINNTMFLGLEFGITDPSHHFVGRIAELKQLANHLTLDASLVKERFKIGSPSRPDVEAMPTADDEDNSTCNTSAEVEEHQASNILPNVIDIAVTGVQGIGKSQIVLRFIEIYSKEFKSVIIIDTENIADVFRTLISYTMTGELPVFYDYLKDKGKSLFMFENFNENIENISEYLPPPNISNFSVLVVSRNVTFANAKFTLNVSSMRHVDAEQLARNFHSFITPNDLQTLIIKFGKHPLALEIVCSCHYERVKFLHAARKSFAQTIQILDRMDDLPITVKISKYNGECNTDKVEWKIIKDIVNRLP